MSGVLTRWQSSAPEFKSILRIVAAFIFIQYGTMKLFGFPVPMPPGNELHAFSQVWCAGVLELVGGGLLLIGFFTRPVAFVLAGEMAVAYFQAHAPNGVWPIANGGTPAVLFCFVWLYYSSAGPGSWSVDAMRSRH